MSTGVGSTAKASPYADPPPKNSTGSAPKEIIRFQKQSQGEEKSALADGQSALLTSPPGLTPQPKIKSALCFPEQTKVLWAECRQCQYCHDYCCRSTEGHVSHRCAQHINW